MSWMLDAVGLQVLAWALGMTVTVVLLDSGSGFLRDHPPMAWRIAGGSAGPLSLVSLICLLSAGVPRWLCLAVVLPFGAMALAWSWAWIRRSVAGVRRRCGREALILGLMASLFVSLERGAGESLAVLNLAAFAGSAALFGGLATTLLVALPGGRRDEVEAMGTPYGVLARITAVGLALTLIALLDSGIGLLLAGRNTLPLSLWTACSLLIPLGLVALGHRSFPRWQSSIWAAALGSALVGQLALQSALLL